MDELGQCVTIPRMVQLPRWVSGLITGSDEIAGAAGPALTALGVAVAACGQPRGREAEREEPPTLDPAPTDAQGGPWTATRLKQVLPQHLHGERVVVVANREPRKAAQPANPAPTEPARR